MKHTEEPRLSQTRLRPEEIDRLDADALRLLAKDLLRREAELGQLQHTEAQTLHLGTQMRWQPQDNLHRWAERLLTELAAAAGLLQCALYMAVRSGGEPHLSLAGTFAAPADAARQHIPFGEGLLGQVAKSGRQRIFTGQVEVMPRTFTGLAELTPRALLLQPLLYNAEVEGVLEASSAAEFTEAQLDLIRRISENLAASLMAIRNQEEMKRLYIEAQETATRMASQEEELRQNMEELQATQEEMQRRQESLLQTMKDLEEERDRRVQLQERTKKMVNDMMAKHKAREEELLAKIKTLEDQPAAPAPLAVQPNLNGKHPEGEPVK